MKKNIILLTCLLLGCMANIYATQLKKDSISLHGKDTLLLSRAIQANSSSDYSVKAPEMYPLTPNASALQQYIDHPVSCFSGLPEISIPLYEIDLNGFKLPTSISYHASGIKAKQEASWVGLGWTLNTGGIITRTIMGKDDFGQFPRFFANTPNDFYTEYSRNYNFALERDHEPDIFSFSINNCSGKFILDRNKNAILLKSEQEVKIEVNFINTDPQLGYYHYAFKITDENGIIYKFNHSEIISSSGRVVEDGHSISQALYTYGISGSEPGSTSAAVNAWYLSEIILPNGENIQFNYIVDIQATRSIPTLSEWFIDAQASTKPYHSNKSRLYISESNTSRELLLQEILWNNGRIVFEHSDRSDIKSYYDYRSQKKLEKIRVYNRSESTPLYTYQFGYEYFNPSYLSTTNDDKYKYLRLKLKTLQKGSANETIETYKFFYNESKPIPPKHTHQYDHWGYFNNNTVTQKLLPRPDHLMDEISKRELPTDGAIRTSSNDYIFLGLLNKITYPTGGSCEFTYEQNSFYHTFEVNNGWERIYIETSETKEEFFEISSQTTVQLDGFLENLNMTCDEYRGLSVYQKPTGFWTYVMKCNNSTQGYTTQSAAFQINNPDEYCHDDVVQLYNPMQEITLSAGKYKIIVNTPNGFDAALTALIKRGISYVGRDAYGGGVRVAEIKTDAKIRKFTYNTSSPVQAQLLATPRYAMIRESNLVEKQSEPLLPLNDFNTGVYVGYANVKETITSGADTSTIEYIFDVEKEQETTLGSEYVCGHKLEPDMYFASMEFAISNHLGKAPRIPVYSNGLPLEVNYYENNAIKKKERLYYDQIEMDTTIYSFKVVGNTIRWNNSLYTSLSFIEIFPYENKVERWKVSRKETTNYESTSSLQITEEYLYGNNFNSFKPTEVRIKRSDGRTIKNTYKYPVDFKNVELYRSMVQKNILKPVIEMAQYLDNSFLQKKKINYTKTTEGIYIPEIEELQKGSSQTEIRIVYNKYDKFGNPVQITKDNQTKIVYLWSHKGQYPIAQIINTDHSVVNSVLGSIGLGSINALADNANPDKVLLDKLHTHSALSGAMVTTYKYKPLVGVIEVTDPSRQTTYYQYDSYNRLKEAYIKNGSAKEILEVKEYHYANQ
ncbi:hypothetical protein [Bacteroides sp. 51]|uniref:hypothetical protein n=1 Tax=Bacteroides sp. 51 TaxID=2302938 RepID=UPI0013D2A3AA|nr:hypothetical protein [Bacteroides sp. 51]NDV80567.1 hypothetical protein [Bacteroides sp. 51]